MGAFRNRDSLDRLVWVQCGVSIGCQRSGRSSHVDVNGCRSDSHGKLDVSRHVHEERQANLGRRLHGNPMRPGCNYTGSRLRDDYRSFFIGLAGTLASYFFVNVLKDRIGVDDALDAFGCHGVSGIVGSILTGLFATKTVNGSLPENGLFYGGGWHMFLVQLAATFGTIIFVAIMGSIIIKVMQLFMPMRVDRREEELGLDMGEHGEEADYAVEFSRDLDRYRSDMNQYSSEFQGQTAKLGKK